MLDLTTLSQLLVLYMFNASPAANTWSDIAPLLYNMNVNIIAITETWFSQNSDFSAYKLHGFSNYFKCRFCRRVGGIMLCVDAKLIFKLLFVSSNDLQFDLLSVKLFTHKFIVITLVYRPPDCSVADTLVLQNLLDDILAKSTSAVSDKLDDFNLLNICWYDPASSSNDGLHKNFHEFVMHNDLYQLVKEPTRNNDILDLLLTSHPDLFRPISIQPSIGSADHDVVLFQFLSSNLSSRGEQSLGSAYNFTKADFVSINATLLNVSWAHVCANCVHVIQN